MKVLAIRGRDWEGWFLALENTKSSSWKGLQVVKYDDRRVPSKAKQTFVKYSDVGGLGWKEISSSDIPPAVERRFAAAVT